MVGNNRAAIKKKGNYISGFLNGSIACTHGLILRARGGTISNCGSISISIFSKISFSISRSISILSLKNNQDQDQYQDQYFFPTQYQDQDQYSQKSKFNINTSVNIFNILILILKINISLSNVNCSRFFVTFGYDFWWKFQFFSKIIFFCEKKVIFCNIFT